MNEPQLLCIFECTYVLNKNDLRYYVGEDCVSKLLKKLNYLAEQCIEEMQQSQDADECWRPSIVSACHKLKRHLED